MRKQLQTTDSNRRKSTDVFITNNTETVLTLTVDNKHRSNHQPYQVKLQTLSSYEGKTFKLDTGFGFTTFAYSKADWDNLSSHINAHPFTPYCYSNVEVVTKLWYEWLYECFRLYIPQTTKNRKELAPWVKPGTSHLLEKKETLQ